MSFRFSPTLVVLAALLIWQLICQLPLLAEVTRDSWGLTDWLVNYSGGFVRRGLAGSILHWISAHSGQSTVQLIVWISYFSYLGLAAWFFTTAVRHFQPAFILSCIALGFPVYQNTIVRKDCLLLLLMIACLSCLRRKWTLWLQWTVVNLICCFGILLHETFAFFVIPALWLLWPSFTWRAVGGRLAALAPAIACFLLVTLHHGTPATARAIHESWMPIWQETQTDPTLQSAPFATIQSIGWSKAEGMLQTKGILQNGIYQPLAWMGVGVITFLLAGRFLKTERNTRALDDWLAILSFQFLCVSPLFLVGVDYGRWIFFWIASSMILFVFGCGLPEGVKRIPIYRRVSATLIRVVGRIPRHEWILLGFGLPVLWSIRNFLSASPIGRLLNEIIR